MSTFAELLLNGVSLGSVYALIALGFVVIFRATEVVNFAHASLLLAGGYVTAVAPRRHRLLARARSPESRAPRWWGRRWSSW